MRLTRRRFLTTGIAAGAALAAGACGDREAALDYALPGAPVRDRGLLEATPSCESDPRSLTARVIEGPFYLPKTPERASLIEKAVKGESLLLVGTVMNQRCEPILGAVLDFWQADPEGHYDVEGMRFRGHQFTDAAGAYQLETLKPGGYRDQSIDRTPHLHVKVQGKGTKLLTTQLYFPDEEAKNAADELFVPETLMELKKTARGLLFAHFDIVLEMQD